MRQYSDIELIRCICVTLHADIPRQIQACDERDSNNEFAENKIISSLVTKVTDISRKQIAPFSSIANFQENVPQSNINIAEWFVEGAVLLFVSSTFCYRK